MANQEKNAANLGDRLKGTLKSLVIDGCSTWTDFVYSESHAGKGLYPQTDTIKDLFGKVVKSKPSQTNDPAYLYHQLLNNWIKSQPQGNVDYPGSVVQALSCFTSKQTNVELRLTEYDKQTCEALRQNVSAFKKNLIVDVRQASFQDEIRWLIALAKTFPLTCDDSMFSLTKSVRRCHRVTTSSSVRKSLSKTFCQSSSAVTFPTWLQC